MCITTSRLCWDLQPSPGKPGHYLHGRFSYRATITLRFFSPRLSTSIEHQQAKEKILGESGGVLKRLECVKTSQM
jgi:hypothetical protein